MSDCAMDCLEAEVFSAFPKIQFMTEYIKLAFIEQYCSLDCL